MKLKSYLKTVIIAICVSFTVEIMAFSLLPIEVVPFLNRNTILQTFVICFIASFAATFPPTYYQGWSWKSGCISYAGLMIAIFGIGSGIFDLIPIEPLVILGIIGCSIIIYAICFMVMLQVNQSDANEINRYLHGYHTGGNEHGSDD